MENFKREAKNEPIYENQEVSRSQKTSKSKGRGKFAVEYRWTDKTFMVQYWPEQKQWQVWRRYKTAKQAEEALKGLKKGKGAHDFIEYRLGF